MESKSEIEKKTLAVKKEKPQPILFTTRLNDASKPEKNETSKTIAIKLKIMEMNLLKIRTPKELSLKSESAGNNEIVLNINLRGGNG
jgi:hypothetical protein